MKRMKKGHGLLLCAAILLLLFLLLIPAVLLVDVAAIGPEGSGIGLATLNGAVRDFFGLQQGWYDLTEYLGYLALAAAAAFACLGLWQLIRRRSLKKVDADILLLAGLYAAVALAYVFFEICVINRRPVLMEGELEASFPSSHTMLVLSIMGGTIYQLVRRIKNKALQIVAVCAAALVAAVTLFGRLASGVHWLTDILGGALLSGVLVFAYIGLCELLKQKKPANGAEKE